ncbi:hypothetical protein SASPL_133883 [Salvia splendens]|uniref:Uncharacterized protein n=1 Tax=Salvia splendens TaxID=180675 RepID=A0A8X8X3W2_SALSN|nr:hypothetical protein SASPL_133883 [Salvia splendens]
MGDSDDQSVFWNDSEAYFLTHDFQTANHDGFSGDDSSGSKRILLSSGSENNHQVLSSSSSSFLESAESSSQSSPLGLTLSKTPSSLNLVQISLKKGKRPVSGKDMPRRRVEEYVSPEKLMASNFPAMHLQIGCIAGSIRN